MRRCSEVSYRAVVFVACVILGLGVVTSTPLGISQAVAFAAGLQDVAAVGQAVQRGAGESLVAEDFGPVLERQVGGQDDAGPFVRGGNDVEEQVGAGLAGRYLTELVEHEQVEPDKLAADAGIGDESQIMSQAFADCETAPQLASCGATPKEKWRECMGIEPTASSLPTRRWF